MTEPSSAGAPGPQAVAGQPPAQPPDVKLRVHQQEALAALAGAWTAGKTRAWVALPPGAGKTLVGLMTVRDRIAAGAVGRAVVLGPNTAIQGQWAAQAAALGLEVGTDRSLSTTLTALTYQALAVFDADDEVDDDGVSTAQADPTDAQARNVVAPQPPSGEDATTVAEVRGAPATSLEASQPGAGTTSSPGSPGFETGAERPPQPPGVAAALSSSTNARPFACSLSSSDGGPTGTAAATPGG